MSSANSLPCATITKLSRPSACQICFFAKIALETSRPAFVVTREVCTDILAVTPPYTKLTRTTIGRLEKAHSKSATERISLIV